MNGFKRCDLLITKNCDIRLVMKSLGFVFFVLVGQGHDEGEGSFKNEG